MESASKILRAWRMDKYEEEEGLVGGGKEDGRREEVRKDEDTRKYYEGSDY